MSRKNKIDPAEKVKIIERVLADEISATEAAHLKDIGYANPECCSNQHLSAGLLPKTSFITCLFAIRY